MARRYAALRLIATCMTGAKSNMATSDLKTDTRFIQEAMHREIVREVGLRFEDLKKKAIEQLDRDKDQIIAGIALYVEKQVSYERMGETLVIRVKTEPIKV